MTDGPPCREDFIVTKEHRRFVEFCDACVRYRYIGLCHGPPGVGKTASARHYACWNALEPCLPIQASYRHLPVEVTDCRTLFYTPTVTNAPGRIATEIHSLRSTFNSLIVHVRSLHACLPEDFPHDCIQLILVDEADRLKMESLEQLRDIYDRGRIGLVFLGMPGLEKRMARFPQLYSRVGFVHPFRPLSAEEMRFILERKWERWGLALKQDDFTDEEAIAAVMRITAGNFRLLGRLLTQVERILQINELHMVTREVVEAARESLVIGTL
jgi:DNA transposition AAA+ family ATPase